MVRSGIGVFEPLRTAGARRRSWRLWWRVDGVVGVKTSSATARTIESCGPNHRVPTWAGAKLAPAPLVK